MKKSLSIILVLMLVLSTLVACDSGKKESPKDIVVDKPNTNDEVKDNVGNEDTSDTTGSEDTTGGEDTSDNDVEENVPAYLAVSGKIKFIDKGDSATYLFMADDISEESEVQSVFILTELTYQDVAEFEIGDEVIGYYPGDMAMTMIFPAEIHLSAIVKAEENKFTKADTFDEELLSKNKDLQLNISEETEIINGDKDSIKGKNLLVIYTVTTKSIPPQTTPLKIVVLNP